MLHLVFRAVFWGLCTFSPVSECFMNNLSFSERVLLAISEVGGLAEALTTWDSLKDTDWDRTPSLADSENEMDSLMGDGWHRVCGRRRPQDKLSNPLHRSMGWFQSQQSHSSPRQTGFFATVSLQPAPPSTIPLTRFVGIECDDRCIEPRYFHHTTSWREIGLTARQMPVPNSFLIWLIYNAWFAPVSRKSPFKTF